MFKRAVLRLTLWYLALAMLLALVFSVALYSVSTRELNVIQKKLEERQQIFVFAELPAPFQRQFADETQARLGEIEVSKRRIALNLAFFNLFVLAGAGLLSYFLAQRTLKPIEEAVGVRDRFTSDASHELRTPLAAMRAELEVALRDEQLSLADSRNLHRSALEEIGKLEQLTGGLLRLARHDAEVLQSTFTECSIDEVVAEAVAKVAATAAQHKVTVVPTVTKGTLTGDHWSLTELLVILLDNAIKYSPAASTVQLRAEVHASTVTFQVRDEGIGIDATDLPHIFDRFYRADHSRSKKSVEGYGLGLALAKQIVDVHRGTIEVASTPGQGSAFTIQIPRSPGHLRKSHGH